MNVKVFSISLCNFSTAYEAAKDISGTLRDTAKSQPFRIYGALASVPELEVPSRFKYLNDFLSEDTYEIRTYFIIP